MEEINRKCSQRMRLMLPKYWDNIGETMLGGMEMLS